MGDNKKTFSDLFSDIESDSEKNNKKAITFDSFIKDIDLGESNDVTDHFVENSLERNQENISKKDNENHIFKEKNNDEFQIPNNLFFSDESDENVEKKIDTKPEIFLENQSEKSVDTSNDNIDNLSKKEEDLDFRNLFFDSNNHQDTNFVNKENIFEEKHSENLPIDHNIFFDNNIREEKDDKKSIKDFSENDSLEFEKNTELNDIFFHTNNQNSSLDIGNTQANDSIQDNNLSQTDNLLNLKDDLKEPSSNDSSIKEISPFFADEFSSENDSSNVSELAKINLMESEKSNKKTLKLDLSNSKHYNVKVVKKKEPLFKFILGVLSYAIFIWLLLIGVSLLVYVLDIKIRAAKGDYTSPTYNAYVVLTGSMLPEIQVNDVVVTKKVDASTLKVGDVITFASADSRFLNTIITHRIIKKEYDSKTKTYSFQTQGDNNNVADSALVPQNNIFGKVILKIPKLGYLQEFLASDGGWIIVILIPCLTVISYDIVKLMKGLKRKKYKNITVQK